MSQNDEQKKAKKDAMKRLRQERKQKIKEIAATMKVAKKAVKAIKEQMKNDVGTVPSIARETGISPDKVLVVHRRFEEIWRNQRSGKGRWLFSVRFDRRAPGGNFQRPTGRIAEHRLISDSYT